MLARVPDNGIGYGLLRDMLRRPELAGRPYPDLSLNYRGQFVPAASGSRFAVAQESGGALIATQGRRMGLLNVDCVAVRGRLNAVFVYSRHKHRAATIEALAERFAQELREVAVLCAESPLPIEAERTISFADQAAGV
jgi:non-ribosomal peptide synthase protein (TIGR01720 family)